MGNQRNGWHSDQKVFYAKRFFPFNWPGSWSGGAKRTGVNRKNVETVGENGIIRIYPYKRELYINENRVNLTRKEFDIFYYLFQKKGDVVSHKELYERVWKREYIHDDTNIMAHIHRLRGKVEKDPKKPKYICNQYGVGYYFGGLFQEALPTL